MVGEAMEIESLDRLEAQVNSAVQLIAELREERERLQKENETLTDDLEHRDGEISSLRAKNEDLGRIYEENVSWIDMKKEMRTKIEDMLSKLDSVVNPT